MSRDNALELKVGAFVLAALVILFFFVTSISDFSFFEKGKKINVVFNFANGLREASPVRLAGVEAGMVKKMKVYTDTADSRTKVHVSILLKEDVRVAKDSTVTINQLGLLGEKYVEIVPGVSKEYYDDNATLTGNDPVPFEKITEQVSVLAAKMTKTVDGINDVLTDKNKKAVEDTLQGFSAVANDLREGRGTAGKFLRDEAIYRNLEELTSDLKANPWKLLYRPKQK